MPAHTRSIEHACADCRGKATVGVYDTWNALIGYFCKRCGEAVVRRLNQGGSAACLTRRISRRRGAMLKTCNACGESKPLDEFHTRKGGRRRAQCKVCTCNQAKYVRLIIEWRFGRTGKRTVAC